MRYNNELKKIETEESAYLLGFLYGDGTITKYVEKNGRIRYLTKLSISIVDEELIFNIKKRFPFFNINVFDYSKYKKNSNKQISISKSSKELYNDLMLNGLHPRKSYENANKITLPKLKSELMQHFIRGFFDADGSVYIRAKRKNLITIEFCSVSKTFLIQIDTYLKNLNINSWKIITKKPSNKNNQTYYILMFIKTSEILKLISYMYDTATISLKRKQEKCLTYKPVNKVLDRNIHCPYCQSNIVWFNGCRNNSKRYKCRSCLKNFSIKIL